MANINLAPAQWILSCNLQKYDGINAFRELRIVPWHQSTNVQIGDIVYIYISGKEAAIRLKCKANAVNLEKSDIDDSKFYKDNTLGTSFHRFMELELIEELHGNAYERCFLEKHDFQTPQSPVHLKPKTQKYLEVIQRLQHADELEPDKHDGSYEMVREAISEYSKLEDLSICDYSDLNLIYLLTIGTWKQSISSKKTTIDKSNLPSYSKEILKEKLDLIDQKSQNKFYSNHEGKYGMFGTGFFSFKDKIDPLTAIKFINLCVDIKSMNDDNEIYDKAEPVLNDFNKGLQAASASVILHCLKPFTFPILNGYSSKTIFENLGIDIESPKDIKYYVKNCREIKLFRDSNFDFKNYRIIDLLSWESGYFKSKHMIDYVSILKYIDEFSGKKYINPDKNGIDVKTRTSMNLLKIQSQDIVNELEQASDLYFEKYELKRFDKILWLDGTGSKIRNYLWAQLKYERYKESPISISISAEKADLSFNSRFCIGLEIKEDKSTPFYMNQYNSALDLERCESSPIVYLTYSNENAFFINHEDIGIIKEKIKNNVYRKVKPCVIIELDDELSNDECEAKINNAVEAVLPYYRYVMGEDISEFDVNEEDCMNITPTNIYDKNMILYGPPGTGKTYRSAIYAVAICDDKSIEELEGDYNAVMQRYNELKRERRIEFTTFHQSYGYEDFIEGIRPVLNTDDADGKLSYKIEDGIFKKFCKEAETDEVKISGINVSEDSVVWKVTIQNNVKDYCFNKNCVRIGWDFDSDGANGFVNEMKAGDIIITTDGSRKNINGICTVSEDSAYEIENESKDPTARKVQWLAKDLNIDITAINSDKLMHRRTVARCPQMKVSEIISLAKSNNPTLSETKIVKNNKPYVFIIDEINRGNISKIFGELITLIEANKRKGLTECRSALLPCSKETFAVPDNVYIIGTMNTADRSIAIMDTALRRRFSFIEAMPDSDILKNIEVDGLNISKMLDSINERITFLYDREHTIGHAFFTSLRSNPTIDNLSDIFKKSVIPLLQEYFYEDYQKIQLVLGDNGKTDDSLKFIKDEDVSVKNIFKGNADEIIDLPEKKYYINESAFSNIESYKQII